MKTLGRASTSWLCTLLVIVGGCGESPSGGEQPLGTTRASLAVQAPELVRDLRTVPVANEGSAPAELAALGDVLLFVAKEASSGRELWRSDGTPEGTWLVRDIHPGPQDSNPMHLTVVGGVAYFFANDGSRGSELWRSDGTAEGTVLVKDISPGSGSAFVQRVTRFQGQLYLSLLGTPEGTSTLWKSDGTPEGTVSLDYPASGPTFQAPTEFAVAGSLLYFISPATPQSHEVWRTDGTREGTVRLRSGMSGTQRVYASTLTPVGDRVYFIGSDPTSAPRTLWTSDGTPEGTQRIIFDSTTGPLPGRMVGLAGLLYFVAETRMWNGLSGYELHRFDGTGVSLVEDIYPSGSSRPEGLVAVGNTLYFSASQSGDLELWKTESTSLGAQRVKDIRLGGQSSLPQNLTAVGPWLYFTAQGDSGGREVWKSDGTAAGTVLVKSIRPQSVPAGSEPANLTAVGHRLFFSANDGVTGLEPWTSDGTSAGTRLVRDILPGATDSSPEALTPYQGKLWFVADTDTLGREPWTSDGTSAGTVAMDLYPGAWSSSPSWMLEMNGVLFFDAASTLGQEPWRTEGTLESTRLLKDIHPTPYYSSGPHNAQVVAGRLHFTADNGSTGYDPWVSDGTTEGTRLLKDLWQGAPYNSMSKGYVEFKGLGYFGATTGAGTVLWRTDGTTAGTVTVSNTRADFATGSAVLPDFFLFPGEPTSGNNVELWRSNGTAAGTTLVRDIHPTDSSWPSDFAMRRGLLYFSAAEAFNQRGLWRSDGTTAGTLRVKGFEDSRFNFNPRNLAPLNHVVLFQATDLEGGTELWRTDGTTQGTWRVKDINPGPVGSMAAAPMLALPDEGLVIFTASDGVTGMEPWVSDGTEAGTQRIADLAPGPYSSNPKLFTRAGDRIYFSASDGVTGRELWRMKFDAVPDVTPPALTCPTNLTVEATSASGAQVTYAAARATDAIPGGVMLTYSQASGTLFSLGATAITVTARDLAGNVATCGFSVTVRDSTPPKLTCPGPSIVAEATSAAGAQVSFPAATATDAVTSEPFVTASHATGAVFPLGSTSVTFTAKDEAGNTGACSFSVVVRDTTRPTITCPGPVIYAEATSASGAVVHYPPATATDAVTGSPLVFYTRAPGAAFPLTRTSVTATARDATGNSSSCTFDVLVRDTTPPSLVCPADLLVEATGAEGAHVSYSPATALDAVTQALTLSYSQASQTVFPVGDTTVTVSTRDAAGNLGSCSFSVQVRDTTAPVLTCPADITAEATEAAGAVVTFPPATASDGVSTALEVSSSHTSGELFALGATTVTVTTADEAGNTASCSFSVTVRDTTAPVLTCPADIVAEATQATGAVVTFPPVSASDGVSTALAVSSSHTSGELFALGATTVTVTATDEAGNTASCSFSVTVRDTTAPVLSCPADIVAEATQATGAVVTFPPVSASDAVSTAFEVSSSHASGGLFALGTTTVTTTATDAAGNKAVCAFSVNVVDTTPPTVVCPGAMRIEATSASGTQVEALPPATAVDAVSASPRLAYSHEPGTRFPLGDTTITVVARDGADNAASCQFILTVKDTQAPSVRCPEDVSVEAQAAQGAAVTFHWDAPVDTVTQEPSLTPSVASGSTFPLGTASVTLTARDDAGNTASCAFSVTVRDTTPPTLVCPAAVEVSTPDASGQSVTYPAAQVHDAVTGAPQVSYSHGAGSHFPLGTTSVRVTATDEAGLSSECTFPVTVNHVSEPAPVPSRPGSHGCAAGPGSSGGLTWLLLMMSTAWWWRRSRGGVSTR